MRNDDDDYTDNLPDESEEEIHLLSERIDFYNRDPTSAIPFEEAIKNLRNGSATATSK